MATSIQSDDFLDPITETTFCLMGDPSSLELYVLDEEEEEWEPVDWDIVEEDEDTHKHYLSVVEKIKATLTK